MVEDKINYFFLNEKVEKQHDHRHLIMKHWGCTDLNPISSNPESPGQVYKITFEKIAIKNVWIERKNIFKPFLKFHVFYWQKKKNSKNWIFTLMQLYNRVLHKIETDVFLARKDCLCKNFPLKTYSFWENRIWKSQNGPKNSFSPWSRQI